MDFIHWFPSCSFVMDVMGLKHTKTYGSWAIGIDMYTMICIKLMTNKNLQYKQTNKQNN